MVPPAPARFSTITCWPSASDSAVWTVRAVKSTLPPGGQGTTMCTGRLGKSWARAGTIPTQSAHHRLRIHAVVFVMSRRPLECCAAGNILWPNRHNKRIRRKAAPHNRFPLQEVRMATLVINGKSTNVDADPSTPLLWVIRDSLGMTGTKFGCGAQLCGACTVHLDGKPVRSCGTPLSAAVGKKITTIEGVSASPAGKKVQQAWAELDVPQCGYCQSGQIMSATALLTEKSKPSDA